MTRREAALAAAASLAVALFWLAPLALHLQTAVLGGPSDVTSTIRQYLSAERQGHSPFTFSHDPSLAAPAGTTFSWAVSVANAIQPLFVLSVKPLVGIVAAFNIFTLLAFVLTAFVTYALLRRLGTHPLAAAFGAYVFAFSPYAFEKAFAGQPGLAHNWVLVVVVLALLTHERRHDARGAALVGAAVALSFYMHTYLGVLALLVAVVFLAVDLARSRAWRAGATGVAVAAGVLLAALAPALVAYAADRTAAGQVGDHRQEALREFGALPEMYVVPHHRTHLAGGAGAEPTLFVGYTTLLLALAAVVLLIRRHASVAPPRRRHAALGAALLVPVAFVVALPAHVTVLGLDLPAPASAFGQLTTIVRVYSRFGVLVGLGLALLAAFALDALVRRRRGRAMAGVVLALAVVELAVAPPPLDVWRVDRPPAYDTWLADQPRGIVALYPGAGDTPEEDRFVRQEIYFQTVHWQPLFFTESAQKGRGWAIRELADNLDEPGVPQLLASQKVRYVVVADDVYRSIGERPPYVPLPLLRRFDGARVFKVVAEPADVEAVLHANAGRVAAAMGIPAPTVTIPGRGFHGPERSALDGRDWRWLIQDGLLEVDVPEADVQFELKGIAFSALRNRLLSLRDEEGDTLAETDIGTATIDFTLGPFRLPAGKSKLTLTVSPPPEPLGDADPRPASIFLSPVEIRPLADYSRR